MASLLGNLAVTDGGMDHIIFVYDEGERTKARIIPPLPAANCVLSIRAVSPIINYSE
jgi:hypothetical protein